MSVRIPASSISSEALQAIIDSGAAKVVYDPDNEREREKLKKQATGVAAQVRDDMDEAARDERLRGEAEARRRARTDDKKR